MAPMPMAMAGTRLSPGRCDMAMPPAAPMYMAGNDRPAAEAAQRDAVGEALAHHEQHERADGVARTLVDESGRPVSPENSTSAVLLSVASA